MRLRGAGYRQYSVKPEHAMKNLNRHWFRHFIVAYSPGGILPLPFEIWLGLDEAFLLTPYPRSEWYAVSLFEHVFRSGAMLNGSLESRITEDCAYLTDNWMFGHWVRSCVSYVKRYWVVIVQADYSLPLSTFLFPLR